MLRIKIDLVPHGRESASRQISEILIANVGHGKSDVTNYDYVYVYETDRGEQGEGKVFDHKRNAGVHELLHRTCDLIAKGVVTKASFTDYDKSVVELMKERILMKESVNE